MVGSHGHLSSECRGGAASPAPLLRCSAPSPSPSPSLSRTRGRSWSSTSSPAGRPRRSPAPSRSSPPIRRPPASSASTISAAISSIPWAASRRPWRPSAAPSRATPALKFHGRYRLALDQDRLGHPEVAAGLLATAVAGGHGSPLLPEAVRLLDRTLATGGTASSCAACGRSPCPPRSGGRSSSRGGNAPSAPAIPRSRAASWSTCSRRAATTSPPAWPPSGSPPWSPGPSTAGRRCCSASPSSGTATSTAP